MRLTKAEADLLLDAGTRDFDGTEEELANVVRSAYWVMEDAPWPHQERLKAMRVLQGLTAKFGFAIDDADPVV